MLGRLSTFKRLSLLGPLLCLAAVGEDPALARDDSLVGKPEPENAPVPVPGTLSERDGNAEGTPRPIRDRAKQRTRRRATSRRRKTRGY